MELFKRIDSFDITFADSFASPHLKVKEIRVHRNGQTAKKGIGEKRLYCGHDKEALDRFFRFDLDPIFFLQKDDLEDYSRAIEEEYLHPSYVYGDGVDATYAIWKRNSIRLSSLREERLYLKFEHKYDDQNRYYISLPQRSKESKLWHDNWDYIREVCLPRVSRLLFVKLINMETKKVYINIKPFYGGLISGTKKIESPLNKSLKNEKISTVRKGQDKYRDMILEYYPYCVVTKVTDPDLLIACHIKDFAKCNADEEYDKYNGFSMTPTIHRLFDLGYLTFNSQGEMVLSDFFRNIDRTRLNLNHTIRIEIRKESLKYLYWHNEHVFIKTSKGINIVNEN